MSTPVLKWPFQMTPQGLTFLEQDTPEEVEQCVALVLSTTVQDLPDEPSFGVKEMVFNGVTESELSDAVGLWEPRALLRFTGNELVEFSQTIGVQT